MSKVLAYFLTGLVALTSSLESGFATHRSYGSDFVVSGSGCQNQTGHKNDPKNSFRPPSSITPEAPFETEKQTKNKLQSWQRIVSLHDLTSEIIVALDRTERLVGIHDAVSMDTQTKDRLIAIPRVENLESILRAQPDIVIGSKVVATRSPDLVRQFERRGVSVYLPDFSSLQALMEVIEHIAQHTDSTSQGDALLQRFTAFVGKSLPSQKSSQSSIRPHPRVFVYDCCDPPFSAGGNTMINELIERAGAENVFSHLPSRWTHVGWEAVLARRPELIVITDYPMEGQLDVDGKIEQLRRFPSLYRLPRIVLPLHQVLGGLTSLDALHSLQRFVDQNKTAS